MKEFKIAFLAQYINHLLGEEWFDIKAHYNNYVGNSKVKGTLQGTINPVFVKGVDAISSSLQLSFEVPCDNNAEMQGYMEKIESICGMSEFILDASYIKEVDGENVTVDNQYKCLMQLQADRPFTAPSESNGYLMIIIMLSGSVLVNKVSSNQPITGYDVYTSISIDNGNETIDGELAIISLSVKIVKEGDSQVIENTGTLTPYMTASNTFYTIDCYDLQRDIDAKICEHIERATLNQEAELVVVLDRRFQNGTLITHKCMVLSDSQIIETPSTFRHYILNLQTMD